MLAEKNGEQHESRASDLVLALEPPDLIEVDLKRPGAWTSRVRAIPDDHTAEDST